MRYLKREIILYIGEDSGGYPLLLVCVQRSWRELVGLAGICLEKLMGLVRLAGICLEKLMGSVRLAGICLEKLMGALVQLDDICLEELMGPVRLVGILKNRGSWLMGWWA